MWYIALGVLYLYCRMWLLSSKYPLSDLIFFGLKNSWACINILTCAFLLFSFVWQIFVHHFIFINAFKMSSCVQYEVEVLESIWKFFSLNRQVKSLHIYWHDCYVWSKFSHIIITLLSYGIITVCIILWCLFGVSSFFFLKFFCHLRRLLFLFWSLPLH